MSNDRMDVWEVDVDEVATSAHTASTIGPMRGRIGGGAGETKQGRGEASFIHALRNYFDR